MTRKQIVEELYTYYLKSGITALGESKPMSKERYIARYLGSVGGSAPMCKSALIVLLEDARNGKYMGIDIK